MSHLPIHPPSPEEQQRVMNQMYCLCGKQVQSYHKHRHMGSNSSVPVELAQDLMISIAYTIELVGGVYAHANLENALLLGQEVLVSKLSKARSMLELVNATAPDWQTEYRWEALRYLHRYLGQYDHLHLAHKGPDDLFYPVLISPPEGIQGIDSCIFHLNILWIENQIMAGVPEDALEQLWERLPNGTVNQCEHLLINGIGKALLGTGINPLVFESEERMQLMIILTSTSEDELKNAVKVLCKWLTLTDHNACKYIENVIPQITQIRNIINAENIAHIFL